MIKYGNQKLFWFVCISLRLLLIFPDLTYIVLSNEQAKLIDSDTNVQTRNFEANHA